MGEQENDPQREEQPERIEDLEMPEEKAGQVKGGVAYPDDEEQVQTRR